jgi:hypothetical protein
MTASIVTLIDGRCVPSNSREWLIECLARDLLARPLGIRRQWLADMERKGDQAGAQELRRAMEAVHKARKGI